MVGKPAHDRRTTESMRSLDNDTPGENDGKGVTSTRDIVYDGSRVQTELEKEKNQYTGNM